MSSSYVANQAVAGNGETQKGERQNKGREQYMIQNRKPSEKPRTHCSLLNKFLSRLNLDVEVLNLKAAPFPFLGGSQLLLLNGTKGLTFTTKGGYLAASVL